MTTEPESTGSIVKRFRELEAENAALNGFLGPQGLHEVDDPAIARPEVELRPGLKRLSARW
jgi:hypothetical protein